MLHLNNKCFNQQIYTADLKLGLKDILAYFICNEAQN